MAAPEIRFNAWHTFSMLPTPTRLDTPPDYGADDPMLNNSLANRELRAQVIRGFEDRGYVLDERGGDFTVAFYATTRERLDVQLWDYGYPPEPPWGRRPRPVPIVVPYSEGAVVVDVVNPVTKELAWRGEGRAVLSDDPSDNIAQLGKAAQAVVHKFPRATRAAVPGPILCSGHSC
jgi:hypothetical protein